MHDLVSLTDIRNAATRIEGVALRTPLVPYLTTAPGRPLWVKAESLQPIGAFKVRGAYSAISALTDAQRARGVVAHSSGNHAQAVAYASRLLGVEATVVAPAYAPPGKLEATRALGAELILVDGDRDELAAYADRMVEERGRVLVPPYDDHGVIAGQGTVGLEILADSPETDVVLVPVSGGGLISGIATAIKEIRPSTKIIGVEPELAGDAQESLRSGRRVAWSGEATRRTSADGLRVPQLGELPFPHLQRYVDDIVTVTEDEIMGAMRELATRARLIAEPSGAVTTAAFLYHESELPAGHTSVAVLSGGNVDPALLASVLAEYAAPPWRA